MEKLGYILCKGRTDRGITLRQMAQDLGISAMYISEIETGKKIPLRGNVLPKIAAYLGIDPEKAVKMSYEEKAKEKTNRMEDDLSLVVARKAMSIRDPEFLKRLVDFIDTEGRGK